MKNPAKHDPVATPIYDDIRAERVRQDRQWGPMHDDDHGAKDWRRFREKFELRADTSMAHMNPQLQRECLVKIAALAVAQIESLDRREEASRVEP